MITYVDQMGFKVQLAQFPKRIVSLVPSQSELLFDLGLEENLVGITKFCIHPKQMHQKITHIGGTKKLNLEKIRSLNPDLIIGNKEENERSQIEELQKQFQVWMSDVNVFSDALNMINSIGIMCDRRNESKLLSNQIQLAFKNINKLEPAKTCIYLIWQNPYMASGGNNFINDMLIKCGYTNLLENRKERYPECTLEEINQLNPEVILLSSEPFPFAQKHVEELKVLAPKSKIILVDGEMFSWYGSRLLKAPAYFNDLLRNLH